MRVLLTGADGFIGKNLQLRLRERADVDVSCFRADDSDADLARKVEAADFIFHLAGVNRPTDIADFDRGNRGLTEMICKACCTVADATGRRIPVLLTSSVQADNESAYGRSKLAAEMALLSAHKADKVTAHIFRLPNVFGKWCRPNYNSVVATFCHNIARGLPVEVHNAAAGLTLVYVDDVIDSFVRILDSSTPSEATGKYHEVRPQYRTTVGELASELERFRESRTTLLSERVGSGFLRALYSTYVSYLPVEEFGYALQQHSDPRGVFVEMMKTPDCGQFSYFTAHPGVTRGGHYHHTKTEKFLVIKGQAKFRFRHMHTNESFELATSGANAEVVETVPGWTHDITNVGEDELIVMLWANEIFDRARPDTFVCPL